MITAAATEWLQLSRAAREAASDFDAQAYTVARLRADLAAEERELAQLAVARDAAEAVARVAFGAIYTDEEADDDTEDLRDDEDHDDHDAYDAAGNR